MASNNEYEICLIDNVQDGHLCAQLISEAFSLNNPLSIFNRTKSEILFNDWLGPLMTDVLDEKLSFLLRHRLTNEIVAAVIASDLFLYCEKHPCHDPNATSGNATVDLFDEMLQQFVNYDFGEKLKRNMVLFISAVGTKSKYLGNGLITQLNTHVCEHAQKTKGFQYVFVQTMHPATRHIYTVKMNGTPISVIDLPTWLWKKKDDGVSCPFKDYEGEPAVNVLVNLNKSH